MHIKVDEDLPAAVAVQLRTSGYFASTVVEQGMGGWKDLSQYDLNDLAGLLTVVTPRSVRIRRGES